MKHFHKFLSLGVVLALLVALCLPVIHAQDSTAEDLGGSTGIDENIGVQEKPDGITPDGTIPDGTKPDGTTPDGATPDGTTPDGATPDGATPDGATPDGATPDGATPDGATPDGATPDGTTPDGTTPDGTTPDGTIPDGTTPDGSTPDGITPDGATPEEEVPALLAMMPAAPTVVSPGETVLDGTQTEVHLTSDGMTVQGSIRISADAEVTLTLENAVLTNAGSTIVVETGAKLMLILAGNNVLTSTSGAGIEVALGGSLEISAESTGSLTATGGKKAAGIGGIGQDTVHGDIAIYGGSVTANGGDGGAGIGTGANNGSGETGSYKIDQANWGAIVLGGGAVTATGGNNAAGIGGGNHVDGGNITIDGGNVFAYGGSGGAGIGSGLGSSKADPDSQGNIKGPGTYFGGEIAISGGFVSATGGWNGAGIGGGMYCDSGYIAIGGGDVTATGGDGTAGSAHHGGAGIGGGYLGHGNVSIDRGNITATGKDGAAGIGSGGTPNSNETRGNTGRAPASATLLSRTEVDITGGTVIAKATGNGAGIGGGNGADAVSVSITGGLVTATGGEGGAGIGSGDFNPEKPKYFVETELSVSITGGEVTATGGWGASGIGSGARNKTANTVEIDDADITAFADGTKFAIDTDRGSNARAEISKKILQGTFMNIEGLTGLHIITTGGTDLTLPAGYRSFAVSVAQNGSYRVNEAGENGRSFGIAKDPAQRSETVLPTGEAIVVYTVADTISDNYFLYPVLPENIRWTVSFESNGGTAVASQSVNDGAQATEPAAPGNSGGYVFGGWYTSPELTERYDFTSAVTCDIILYAQWTFNGGGGGNGGNVLPRPTPTPDPVPETDPTVDIGEEETPLAPGVDLPSENTAEEPNGDVVIVDEQTPLGDLPLTGMFGAGGGLWLALLAMLCAVCIGGAALVLSRKQR